MYPLKDIICKKEARVSSKINMKSEDFNWEVPVETVPIPSGGVIYGENSWFFNKETVDIKAMTAHEEDILASQAYIKKGTAVEELIKSCIMSQDANIKDLISGDRNAIAISIRITGYGADYDAEVTCPKCRHQNKKTFDLSSLEIKRLGADPVQPGKNLFEYKLPVSKKVVYFKLLTGKEEEIRDETMQNKIKLMGAMAVGPITSNLESMIVSIDGIEDKGKISKFIKVMPALDSRKLRAYMNKIQPGIDMTVKYTCENCGAESSAILPINSNFFWPAV